MVAQPCNRRYLEAEAGDHKFEDKANNLTRCYLQKAGAGIAQCSMGSISNITNNKKVKTSDVLLLLEVDLTKQISQLLAKWSKDLSLEHKVRRKRPQALDCMSLRLLVEVLPLPQRLLEEKSMLLCLANVLTML